MSLSVYVFSHAVDEAQYYERHRVHTGAEGVEDEKEEIFVISNSNAIINPRTVVVHFDDASFAYAAMVCTVRFERITTTA